MVEVVPVVEPLAGGVVDQSVVEYACEVEQEDDDVDGDVIELKFDWFKVAVLAAFLIVLAACYFVLTKGGV
jgi:hypothetical protein